MSLSVIIRKADSTDLPFVEDLSRRVFQRYGPYEEILPQWFTSGLSMTILADTRRGPVGFAMIARTADRTNRAGAAEIMAIAVEPTRQGQGVGRALMDALESEAREASLCRLLLHTATDNKAAKALFSLLGFRVLEIRKAFYPQGQDALLMCKTLGG
jgi:ribosomal-protein-alanine N-acetyltransferase